MKRDDRRCDKQMQNGRPVSLCRSLPHLPRKKKRTTKRWDLRGKRPGAAQLIRGERSVACLPRGRRRQRGGEEEWRKKERERERDRDREREREEEVVM